MTGPELQLLAQLESTLQAGPPLRLALLFGSAARGTARADSDLDVGIVPCDPDLPLSAELDLETRIAAACGRNVDVVRLDRSTTVLRWQAARDGVLLLAHPPQELARFRARAAIEHAELRIVRDPAAERFRKVLASGASSSVRE